MINLRVLNNSNQVPKNYIRIYAQYIKESEKSIYFSWEGIIKHLPKSKMIKIDNGVTNPIYYIQNWCLKFIK